MRSAIAGSNDKNSNNKNLQSCEQHSCDAIKILSILTVVMLSAAVGISVINYYVNICAEEHLIKIDSNVRNFTCGSRIRLEYFECTADIDYNVTIQEHANGSKTLSNMSTQRITLLRTIKFNQYYSLKSQISDLLKLSLVQPQMESRSKPIYFVKNKKLQCFDFDRNSNKSLELEFDSTIFENPYSNKNEALFDVLEAYEYIYYLMYLFFMIGFFSCSRARYLHAEKQLLISQINEKTKRMK